MKLKTMFPIVALLLFGLFAGCDKDDDNNNYDDNVIRPSVSTTDPANNATDVFLNKTITATFNESMAPRSFSATTFTLFHEGTKVEGTISCLGTTASFNPTVDLLPNSIYTITITNEVKNLLNKSMKDNFIWVFTTGTIISAPSVISTNPENNATNVVLNKVVKANFSEAMNSTSINETTFTLFQEETQVAGTVSYSGTTASFDPTVDLLPNTIYTITITNEVGNVSGLTIENDYIWGFTTGTIISAPSVISTDPENNATNVVLNKFVKVNFSEAMNSSTIDETTFNVKQGETLIEGTITYSGTTATFTPTNLWDAETIYTATITSGVENLSGIALENNTEWNFTTGTETASLEPVFLGAAGNYVILAKTAISNISTSAITGDLGLSPAATSYITGLSLTNATGYATSAQVTGLIYAADMADPTPINLTTAVENMITAYNDAAGRPFPDFLELATGSIGGLTLTPGLYKWTNTVSISSDITISGGANDVWIFQISEDLLMSNDVNITLIGGAQAKNIFWQLAGQATLGTNSHFEGIILSMTGINFQTGASFYGRALAQTAVVLDGNAITEP